MAGFLLISLCMGAKLTPMTEWLSHIKTYLLEYGVAITAASAIMFVASAWLIPIFIARMPADYFQHKRHSILEEWRMGHHARVFGRIGKNLLGYVLLVLGILMLVLPGQGLLTILVAIIFYDDNT